MTVMTAPKKRASAGRAAPLLIIAAGAALGAFLLRDVISFETLRENREALLAWRDANYLSAALVYLAAYIAVVAFSLPGATVMTLTGGFLFGIVAGAGLTVIRRDHRRHRDLPRRPDGARRRAPRQTHRPGRRRRAGPDGARAARERGELSAADASRAGHPVFRGESRAGLSRGEAAQFRPDDAVRDHSRHGGVHLDRRRSRRGVRPWRDAGSRACSSSRRSSDPFSASRRSRRFPS